MDDMTMYDNQGDAPDYTILYQFGEVLDAVDAGMQVFEVDMYREVLCQARQFILRHWGHPQLARECHRSGALGDLYDFTEHQKRLAPKLALLGEPFVVLPRLGGWAGCGGN
jgi:hypothetical protein